MDAAARPRERKIVKFHYKVMMHLACTALFASFVTGTVVQHGVVEGWYELLLLSLSIALVAGIIAKSMAWHMIVKHLSLTIRVMQDLAKGEGDLTQRLAVTKNDEISEVARCFNIFMDKLHDIVCEVKEAAEGVGQASEQLSRATELIASGGVHSPSVRPESVLLQAASSH